jgi:sporulation protein YlmC with PRC-barrel domain
MEQWSLNDVTAGMEVCDVNGDTIGTVAHVHRGAPVGVGTAGTHPDTAAGVFIEVKSGFLVFGHHYYVPASAVQSIGDGCLVVDRAKGDLGDWETKPADLGA